MKTLLNAAITMAILLCILSCNKQRHEEKMLDIIKETSIKFYNANNSFCPEARLTFIDSIIKFNQSDNTSLNLNKNERSGLLLQLGQSKVASNLLQSLLIENNNMGQNFNERLQVELRLAYLRTGEQTNCIINHGAEMCIFPIKKGGVHKDFSGSRAAIKEYENILKKHPEDLETRWLTNIAYMTLGEYPENVPKEFLIPNLGERDDMEVKPFEDVAKGLGLDTKDMAGGTIMEDFDNDGYIDIIKSCMDINTSMKYFKNNGDGSFTDISERSRICKFKGGLNITQTDYNNDGFKDIFVLRGAWFGEFGNQPNSLLKNNGDGTFSDVTIESGLLSFHPTQAATWNDFNNDGWLDLFIGNESGSNGNFQIRHKCELYINNKNGTFSNVASKAFCDIDAFVKGVTSGDFNNDGLKDIYISTMNGKKYLLRNNGIVNGNISFKDVADEAGLNDEKHNTFPTWFWDYDNDGWLDIFVCDYTFNRALSFYAALENLCTPEKYTGQPFLYHNNHDGTFTNVTKVIGLNKTAFAMGANFGDIDNDGFLDFYLGTGNPSYKSLVPNKMFKNIEGRKFADVTSSAKVGNLQKGHGIGFADMDNDGDQDVFIEMGGAYTGDAYQNSFFLNPGQNNNNWLSIKLEGTKSNNAAIGTKIKVTFIENGKKRSVYRDVNSGGSFGSSTLNREIGIGQAKTIDELEIKWHGSGLIQTFKNISPNKFIKITEGQNEYKIIKLKRLNFKHSHSNITVCSGV